MNNTIAVVELGDSHEECLSSSLYFLSQQYQVDLYINGVPWQRCQEDLQAYCHKVQVIDSKKGIVSGIDSLRLALQLQKQAYKAVFLNTAQGRIKFFCLFSLFNRSKFVGLLHNVQKLQKGFGQQLISNKVKHYLVLNDYLQPHAQALTNKPVSSFYPIFFPQQRRMPIKKPQEQVWISIPGRVDYKRRDYQALIGLAQRLKNHPQYKFLILGNIQASEDGRQLAQDIQKLDLSNQFICFNSFVSTPMFLGYIQASDIVLPLISPKVTDFDKYLRYKITGSWNMAFAFQKPLLVDPAFMQHADFQENAVAFNLQASEQELIEQIRACRHINGYQAPKWKRDFQQQNLLRCFEA